MMAVNVPQKPVLPSGLLAVPWRVVRSCVVVLVVVVLLTIGSTSANVVRIPNMESVSVIQGLRAPTDFAWTPDLAWLVITGKNGPITVYNAETFQIVNVAGDLSNLICTESERGIQSVVIHPTDFVANKMYYLYIFHVRKGSAACAEPDINHFPHPNGPTDRVSRFTLNMGSDDATLDMGSELVIFDTGPVGIKHNGGGMAFGNDGNLYVTTGDAGYRRGREAVAVTWTDNLHGKVLRFTPTGDVPADNPYVNESDPNNIRCSHLKRSPTDGSQITCREIYSRGLRNPFNLAMDPNTQDHVRFFINDVGDANWEEINEGGSGYETKSYGWNSREGPCLTAKRESPGCAQVEDPSIVDPVHWYAHPDGGAASTGGTFVPLNTADSAWSTQYGGEFLSGDMDIGILYHLSAESGQYCRGVNCAKQVSNYDPIPILTGLSNPLRMHFGPFEGAARPQHVLYFLQYGQSGRLWRVSSPDPSGSSNRQPSAVIKIFYDAPDDGSALMVLFDGGYSSDPDDGDQLTYTWDFGEGSTPTSNNVITMHDYRVSGRFTVTLTVDDGNGGTSQESVDIRVNVNTKADTAVDFVWSNLGCRDTVDYCGVLDFCHDDSSAVFGYKLPCESECLPTQTPIIRLQPGKKYQLTLRNTAQQQTLKTTTNIHTHGLHISGSGDGDDVTRRVKAGNCLTYTWDLPVDHPRGTYWYHPHPHGHSEEQVAGGAYGLLIVDDNAEANPDVPDSGSNGADKNPKANPDVPDWASNELLLQISRIDEVVSANKKPYEIFRLSANQWYRLRVSIVDPVGEPLNLMFTPGCEVHKVASDGVWHSSVPGPLANRFEMSGASRGDFAIRCVKANSTINILYSGKPAAIVKVGSVASTPYNMTDWNPVRPASLQGIASGGVPDANRFTVTIQRESLNNEDWNPDVPLRKVAFNEVHEWELGNTRKHPFHMHLYHMMVVTPGGCGSHKEGEFYDTIAGPPCTVRFLTADIGQRCVFHCHVMLHSDLGAMGWVDVDGEGMPTKTIASPEYTCPTVPLERCHLANVPSSG